jgi:hypothetical protein
VAELLCLIFPVDRFIVTGGYFLLIIPGVIFTVWFFCQFIVPARMFAAWNPQAGVCARPLTLRSVCFSSSRVLRCKFHPFSG